MMAHTRAGPSPVATYIGGEAETAVAAFGDPVNVVGAPVAAEAEPAVMPPRAAMVVRVAAVQIMTLRRMGVLLSGVSVVLTRITVADPC
jgi:hypothetical protein